jgi:hypothetical protein
MELAMTSSSDFTIQKDAVQPMRDGALLRADIYLPEGDGPFPTILERTPYNKEDSSEVKVDAPAYFASRGYAVVIQDVRGRFKSDGDFRPFHDDGWGLNRDGYDTVAWIAAQPWCDDNIGAFGGSYSGATQYRLAPTRPPHLKAMYVRESSADYGAEWVYRGGAFELGFMLSWALGVTNNNLAHLATGADFDRQRGVLEKALAEIESWQRHLPLNPTPLFEGLSDWYNEFLAHPDDGPYWWQWNIAHQHDQIDVPIYHLGGWFDIFLNGTIENFTGIKAKARSPEARPAQRLIIGPWIHGPWQIDQAVQGEVDFGPDAVRNFNELRLPWFDFWLKGIDNGVMNEPPVKLFVMGENRWRTAADYPLPNTRYTNWFLHEDGNLDLSPPTTAESPDNYLYDPDDPVPTRGGNTLGIPGGAWDQRPVEGRCLTYTSQPLAEDLTIIGPVRCILHAMSSAPDTDWVVRLTDVSPDGFSRLLCDGILRARYRRSRTHPTLLTPDQVYEFEVDLWATANTFRAGHRLRVAVTSSNFPRFDRNLNTGGPANLEARGEAALNTIFHDLLRPSHIILPVLGS